MMQLLASALREALAHGAYTVTFTKADGSERKMVCTTKHDLIAEANGRDLTPGPLREGRKKPEELITAYDLENTGWRSFYSNSVTSFEPFMENGTHVTERL